MGRSALPVDVQQRFWVRIRGGEVIEDEARAIGVSKTVAWRVSAYWPGGVRHGGGVSPVCGVRVEQEKACPGNTRLRGWGRGSVLSGPKS
jgi:hypothetical protein